MAKNLTLQTKKSSTKPSAWIRNISYALAAVAIFAGFWFDAGSPTGQRIFCVGVVALLGIAALIRHNLTATSDAARLGFAIGGYQYEVGFANLAFGLAGLVTAFVDWGAGARIAIIFCFALYILQTFFLHLWRTIKGEVKPVAALQILLPSGSLTLVLFIATALAAQRASLWPF